MCGIAGIFAVRRANARLVHAMNDVQRHRGPDGSGVWTSPDGAVAFGHRRLSIIDLSEGGAQPMTFDELGLTITYNGEIYNYLELRERLEALGHRFRTHTDTEVLVRAYAQWGEACLAELNGMFAFAIWNDRARTLFSARDRFGEKPFVYATTTEAFVFASEAKALALARDVDLGIDDGVLAVHVERGSTWVDASERTLLRGVRQLLPGHAMRVTLAGDRVETRVWSYWSIDVAARHAYGSDDPARSAKRLLELLTDSVKLRMRSDVKVGSCLSGGLDSSAIVMLMRRLAPKAELCTFTGRFPGDPLDEGMYASLVVDAAATQYEEVSPTPERFLAEATRVYWHAEFPIGGMSQFAQWCVFHLASQHGVTVLLDGQGSDEQLGGYGNEITVGFLAQLAAERRARAWLHERGPAARSFPSLFTWPRLALGLPGARELRPLLRRATNRSTLERASLFRTEWYAHARGVAPRPSIDPAPAGEHALSRVLWTLSFRTMLSSLLRFGDRLSMAHSREVRLPFCDPRVAELAFSLSPELLVGEGEVKRVLRRAIDGVVPRAIVTRPKQGFIPPQNAWLVGPLASWVRELTGDLGPLADRVDGDAVRRIARASDADRARDVVWIWETANVLAWGRYALEPMRASQEHDLVDRAVDGLRTNAETS